MKPFLLISCRPEDDAAIDEYEGFLRASGLLSSQLEMIRASSGPLPEIHLDAYSGIVVGGGPYNSSDPPEQKSPEQRRVESDLHRLLDEVVERDFPFLGACYGIGTLGVHQGGIIDRTYAEPVGAVPISVTEAGAEDPLLEGMPRLFDAYVGHKEACTILPPSAVLLASTPACPVQMFRVRSNLYATQFHPELDHQGILTRIRVYRHSGYFPPEEADEIAAQVIRADVDHPPRILVNFVARYGS